MIRLLVFTTLYPNAAQPRHGIFVEQRLRHLVASGGVHARVVAPVPWFPSTHPRFGRYAMFASVPPFERRHGLEVWHPRYPVIPKLGMNAAPFLLAGAVWRHLRRLRELQDFDAVDAHYLYPDGVAAVGMARRLCKPVVMTARGSDLNVIARYPWPRRAIRWAASKADHVITVSDALRARLESIAVPLEHVTALPNGVDLSQFCPGERGVLAREFGFKGPILLSVGHLVEGKGHHIVIDALAELPNFGLIIVGAGKEERALRERIKARKLESRVHLAGAVPHERLTDYYRSADALVLASRSEGMPNVVLEALACGTPVVASAVGGIPEVVKAPEAGCLVNERSPQAFVKAIKGLFAHYPDRRRARRFAEQFDWGTTTRGQLEIFQRICWHHATACEHPAR